MTSAVSSSWRGELGRTADQIRRAVAGGGAGSPSPVRTCPGRSAASASVPRRAIPIPHGGGRAGTAVADPRARRGRAGQAFELYRVASRGSRASAGPGRARRVEAVTGTGKTMLGSAGSRSWLAAARCAGSSPCAAVHQWRAPLARHGPARRASASWAAAARTIRAPRMLVAVVNSARDTDLRPRRPGGLLVGDECHRYGTEVNRVAPKPSSRGAWDSAATFARPDRATGLAGPLLRAPCYRIGHRRAIAEDHRPIPRRSASS